MPSSWARYPPIGQRAVVRHVERRQTTPIGLGDNQQASEGEITVPLGKSRHPGRPDLFAVQEVEAKVADIRTPLRVDDHVVAIARSRGSSGPRPQ